MKTKEKLKTNTLSLWQEKGIRHLTIREVTTAAGISHGAFYVYYENMNRLLEDIENDMLQDMKDEMKKEASIGPDNAWIRMIYFVFEFVAKRKKFFEPYFTEYHGNHFTDKMIDIMDEIYGKENTLDSDSSKFLKDFILQGCVGILRRWVASGMHQPLEEIVSMTETVAVQCKHCSTVMA